MHQKQLPDPIFNFEQPLHARNFFKNKIFSKRIIKALRKGKGA